MKKSLTPTRPGDFEYQAKIAQQRIDKKAPPLGSQPKPVSHPPRIVRDPLKLKGEK